MMMAAPQSTGTAAMAARRHAPVRAGGVQLLHQSAPVHREVRHDRAGILRAVLSPVRSCAGGSMPAPTINVTTCQLTKPVVFCVHRVLLMICRAGWWRR
jgi:hypothetical protein